MSISAKILSSILGLVVTGLTVGPAQAGSWGIRNHRAAFRQTIKKVVSMPHNQRLQSQARRHGLNVVNVTWEDTGRYQGSSVGPNISDLTLQVKEPVNGGYKTHLLPVIRHPNFSDKTGDVAADKLWVRVGNHSGGDLEAVPLTEVLSNLKEYISDPSSLTGNGDFLAKRDTHFLVSAQHVFLPIPKRDKVEFSPVLYNYQSYPGAPAVLTLLVTREGTSATIIDNAGGEQSHQGWGQQLFFNNDGQKTMFTAERRSDVKRRIESGRAKKSDAGALEEGADMMMIVQVPLKVANRYRGGIGGMSDDADGYAQMESGGPPASMAAPSKGATSRRSARSDVEKAVLGHGDDLGPFREMANLKLERDDRFPVRVTVQFYKATSNGVASAKDLADAKKAIDRVYADADYVGSLVVPKGQRRRPTEWKRHDPRIGWRWMGNPHFTQFVGE